MTKKIPSQIFVVSQNRTEIEYPVPGNWNSRNEIDHNFGFLHPHEPTKKTDASRKHTQMSWAYRGEAYENNGIWWERGVDYEWDQVTRNRNSLPYDRPIDPLYAPRVWDNVPMTGFTLIDTVNRYRGNKLFKVMDPRGVEFEITVQSLYHILCEGTVSNGEIKDACVWAKGKDLVVANSVSV
jgi:hypothetical protein